uniref:Putative secreted protein n=1 Tax=Anopheles triannulatus TaxID=58253 RepID=A0A2M4B3A8_9DIPT
MLLVLLLLLVLLHRLILFPLATTHRSVVAYVPPVAGFKALDTTRSATTTSPRHTPSGAVVTSRWVIRPIVLLRWSTVAAGALFEAGCRDALLVLPRNKLGRRRGKVGCHPTILVRRGCGRRRRRRRCCCC